MGQHLHMAWRARLKKRRGKAFNPIQIRELNLVAMMDMLTILLVFLLKSYSISSVSIPVGEEINVPKSSNIVAPPEAVKITVTKASPSVAGVIAVDDEKIVELDKGKMSELKDMAKQRNYKIDALHKVLLRKAEGIKFIAKQNPAVKFDGKIMVIADKDTPYWLITEVLFTSAEASFDQYKLVAMKLGD